MNVVHNSHIFFYRVIPGEMPRVWFCTYSTRTEDNLADIVCRVSHTKRMRADRLRDDFVSMAGDLHRKELLDDTLVACKVKNNRMLHAQDDNDSPPPPAANVGVVAAIQVGAQRGTPGSFGTRRC